ncbi:KDEL motif-containing protein 1-like, partial [Limulus polyphemus]|uniref:KDEL motif-containing protein 1-like n=1 Tax=Limulus polyphemus TaxID=6850 RepID=A0ABM1TQ39_LIMPO
MRKSTCFLDCIVSFIGSRFLLAILSIFLHLKCAWSQDLDQKVMMFSHEKSLVYGPGFQKDFHMPVRYFFIQAVDVNGENFTESPSGKLEVHITGYKQNCRIWTQLFDQKNGIYIARYKLYDQCSAVEINVKYEGQPVRESPYIVEGPLYHEHCYCPVSLPTWLDLMSCYGNYSQIHADLSNFPQVDMEMALDSAIKRFNMPGAISFCHYSVIKNEVYRKCYGQHVGFNMFMDAILLSVTRKVQLPDLEMLVNLGDWPLEKRLVKDSPIPFFSWCGSKDTRDIVMPTYDITEATLEMMGRVTLDIFSVMGNSGPKWENKVEKGFWRGRDSRQERLDLVKLGRKYPDLIDAALTNFFFFRDQENELGPKVPHVSFFDFFK